MLKRPASSAPWGQLFQTSNTINREPVNPAPQWWTHAAKRFCNVADFVTTMKHQHSGQSAGMIFVACLMNSFLYQASFVAGYRCYDRYNSVRLVVWDIQRLIRSLKSDWIPFEWSTIWNSYLDWRCFQGGDHISRWVKSRDQNRQNVYNESGLNCPD